MKIIRDRSSVTAGEMAEKFIYDPRSGKIYRRLGDVDWSTPGKEAFCRSYGGYFEGNYANLSFVAHRVAWAIHFGEWPNGQIDHINGDRQDNRICNLRVVTNLENCRNLGRRKTKIGPDSGVIGVYWHKQSRKWMARIKKSGKWIYLGTYSDLAEATKVRRQAERANGFHPNHGQRPALKMRRSLSLSD